ncbi:DNA cytosine methyltransferase [Cobetia sp. 4B]|uniref:DNA cytosine methyltransferase n=1 Tax=Cobetia sp. 4B TaxID=2758724 RepID=UPI001C05A9D0|nr:DNA cytosine methyltransferase [Cobetia sp. 4B]MBR9799320.1 DNA cytosine methyltransferase [Gammaproteobacteria bacterium]QWN37856.1 DNA cytosine methyltransferase [Cobetia sp. 4B]
MNVIDLFAGGGGFSTGASMAGCNVAWAANHWPDAVEWHSRNHPNAAHICQDLHQADWSQVPAHDLMLASPCCQGHSKARGKASGNPQHDASRSTAWAVVSAAEYHRPPAILVENVPEFLDWQLYRPWVLAMQALGYAVSPHVVDAADLGAPQNRIRMFLVLTQSAQPLKLNLPTLDHLPAASFIDFEAGRWQPIEKPGRAAATLERVRAGRTTHGDRFLISYYGNTKTGRSLDRPIGTITTRDRWAIVDGDRMRMLSRWECRSAMSFPDTYQLPDNHRLAVHLLGNAVCPTPVSHIIKALQQAA